MPTTTSSFSAHLVDRTNARVTWTEVDFTLGAGNVSATLDAVLKKNGLTLSTALDARLSTSVNAITTSLDAHLGFIPGSRDVTRTLGSVLAQDQLEIFFALDLEFDAGEINLWTGAGDLVIGGKTYTGTGTMLSISDVEETSEIAVKGATLNLSGISSTILSLALSEQYQGRICTIYFGAKSDTSEMTEVFSGYMDQMNISENGATCTIELSVQNRLVDLEKPGVARFTSAYQKSIYPNDRGLDFIEDLQDKRLVWGRKPAE